MPTDGAKQTQDEVYVLQQVFPEAASLLLLDVPPVQETIGSCDVVLDTNVLLLPYRAGQSSIDEISTVYKSLADEGRLFVPAQAAREFAKHRASKIAEMYKALADERSRPVRPKTPSFPLLEGLEESVGLVAASEGLVEAIKGYQRAIDRVQERVRDWGWNDPVAQMYREVLAGSGIVRAQSLAIKEVRKRLAFRYEHKIPPGYKDASKDDDGIGDFLIWLTILELGAERKKPLVFVTGEEKSDWQHRADNRGLMPRFELVDEYRRATEGRPFYLVQLSQLLSLMNVGADVVEEIREEEDRRRERVTERVECPNCESPVEVRLGVEHGSTATPTCEDCGKWFYTHRRGEEVITRLPHTRTDAVRTEGLQTEIVQCPYCGEECETRLGLNYGDSAAPSCDACGQRFHAHRGRDGVFARRRGDLVDSDQTPPEVRQMHEGEGGSEPTPADTT